MHDINYSAPDRPPSGDAVFKFIAWGVVIVVVVIALLVGFAIYWPTWIGD